MKAQTYLLLQLVLGILFFTCAGQQLFKTRLLLCEFLVIGCFFLHQSLNGRGRDRELAWRCHWARLRTDILQLLVVEYPFASFGGDRLLILPTDTVLQSRASNSQLATNQVLCTTCYLSILSIIDRSTPFVPQFQRPRY
jgi:hypothetical protein